jgi:hypothetical protein
MPESVTDRPTKAHEYVFLLTKQPRYFFDQEAVREPALRAGDIPGDNDRAIGEFGVKPHGPFNGEVPAGRNIRSVWEIATQPYPEAHFATFPEELVRRCLLAGCPEQVCICPGCSVRYVHDTRMRELPDVVRAEVVKPSPPPEVLLDDVLVTVQREEATGTHANDQGLHSGLPTRAPELIQAGLHHGAPAGDGGRAGPTDTGGRSGASQKRGSGGQSPGESGSDAEAHARQQAQEATAPTSVSTLQRGDMDSGRDEPRCKSCDAPLAIEPGVVLDPFAGSGTTALVARKHGRRAVGIELNAEYCELIVKRTQQLSLLSELA